MAPWIGAGSEDTELAVYAFIRERREKSDQDGGSDQGIFEHRVGVSLKCDLLWESQRRSWSCLPRL